MLASASLLVAAAPHSQASQPGAEAASVTVNVSNVRNDKGQIRICMTQNEQIFPKCNEDPEAVRVRVPAMRDNGSVEVKGLTKGDWMMLVLHDENSDGKLKRSLGIPREGFGFSRNPSIKMRPPRPDEVRITLPAGHSEQNVKVKYIL